MKKIIQKIHDTDFDKTKINLKIDNTSPIVEKRMVELAKVHTSYATIYAQRFGELFNPESIGYVAGKLGANRTGYAANISILDQFIEELDRDLEDHRKLFRSSTQKYFRNKVEPSLKKDDYEVYLRRKSTQTALRNMKKATDALLESFKARQLKEE